MCDEVAWVMADGWEPYPTPIPVRFEFDSNDAFAVRMCVHGTVWRFARTLLGAPSSVGETQERWRGEGDVKVACTSDTVCIALSAPDGRATLVMPARSIQAFVNGTDEIVPPGQELYDVDTWIGRFLQEEERA